MVIGSIYGIIYGVALTVVAFLGHRITTHYIKFSEDLISFAAGISVTYLFLQLLPEVYVGISSVNRGLFFFILLGFSAFHLVEKFIYRHARKKVELIKELREAHIAAVFFYHFILGILQMNLTVRSLLDGTLFFIPVALHVSTSEVSLRKIHVQKERDITVKYLLSFSILLGVLVALIFEVTELIHFSLMGLIGGVLLYIIIRESLPSLGKGAPRFFVMGTIIYSFLIVITWLF